MRSLLGLTVRAVALSVCFSQTATAGDAVGDGVAARTEPRGADAPSTTKRSASERRHRLRYRDEWRRFRVVDYVATGAILSSYAAVRFAAERPDEPKWAKPVLFDDAFRNAFMADSRDARARASHTSDFTTGIVQGWAVGLDSLVIPLVGDRWNFDVAWQMTMMNVQAMGLVAFLTLGGKIVIARERPVVQDCRDDPEHDEHCFSSMFTGFPSGHTSSAFAASGLLCAHHLNQPLYGGGVGDPLACAGGVALATTSGILRMVADRHYATDVFAGAALGFGVGFLIPHFVYYRAARREPEGASTWFRWAVTPTGSPTSAGAALFGLF